MISCFKTVVGARHISSKIFTPGLLYMCSINITFIIMRVWVAANWRTINHQENVTNICSYFTYKMNFYFYQSPNSALKCPTTNFKWNSVQQILAYKAINHQINWEKKNLQHWVMRFIINKHNSVINLVCTN